MKLQKNLKNSIDFTYDGYGYTLQWSEVISHRNHSRTNNRQQWIMPNAWCHPKTTEESQITSTLCARIRGIIGPDHQKHQPKRTRLNQKKKPRNKSRQRTRSISSPTNDKPEIPNPWQTRSPWDTSKGMLLLIEGFQTSMSHHILDQIKVTSGPDFDKHTPTLNLSTSRLHQDASRSIKKRKTHQKRHQKSRNIKRHQDASRNQRRIKKHQETKKRIKKASKIKKHQNASRSIKKRKTHQNTSKLHQDASRSIKNQK